MGKHFRSEVYNDTRDVIFETFISMTYCDVGGIRTQISGNYMDLRGSSRRLQ